MLKHHSHNPAATKIIWSGRGLLNIVNLGPLDEDLEALTHWQDEENTFLESQHCFQGYSKAKFAQEGIFFALQLFA